jgi:DNA polymerase elongation subunit (family B)
MKKHTIIKKTKSFRCIDFNIYDGYAYQETENSENDSDDSTFNKKNKQKQMIIQMFGIDTKGQTYCLYIEDFKPFFFIQVGDKWTPYDMECFIKELKEKHHIKNIDSYQFIESHKLYGFTGGRKYKFIQISFENMAAMNKCKNLWYSYQENNVRKKEIYHYNHTNLEIYETQIPPLLRYFHIHSISPSGWVTLSLRDAMTPDVNKTSCNYEYICSKGGLKPLDNCETRVPYKICSFDIEASSSHGDFPVPIKVYKRLSTQLVDVFNTQLKSGNMDKERGKVFLKKIVMTSFGYDKVEGIDLVYPISKQSKTQIESRAQIFVEQTIEKAKTANSEEDNSYLLTIDDMFAAIHESMASGSGDGDVEGDDAEDEENITMACGDEEEEIPHNKTRNKAKRLGSIEKQEKVIDVLFSTLPEHTRDVKITIISDVLTLLFPKLEGDKVTFIGSTFLRYGEQEPYLNHCVVLGSCEPVEGAVIEPVHTERELLLKWTELIQKEDPDIIIGYNIFGFDYEFMFRRSQENRCEREFLLLSRNIGELSGKPSREKPDEILIETQKLQIASGEYNMNFPKMVGRLQIDMLAYFRRDFNLSSYKLDNVAGAFISDTIIKNACSHHPVFGDVTELYSNNLLGLHVGDFIHIEVTGFTSDYYKAGKKFVVLEIRKDQPLYSSKTTNIIVIQDHHIIDGKSIKWGMAKDDVSPQDIFKLANGSASDRAIVAKYCIQDCNLVHHLVNKIDVITGYIEMASICSVPISFLVFRGQGIKLTSYVAKQCRIMNTLMPDLEKSYDADGYEGAIVLDPKCAIYMDNPVACLDYSSLYPSIMISANLSPDSKVWTKEYDLDGKLIKEVGQKDKTGKFIYDDLSDYRYLNVEYDTFKYIRKSPTSKAEKTKVGKKICRWVQYPDNKKAIMPAILESLLKARSDTRKKGKTEKDPFMQNILDKRQLGYKVTANSLYGQCGSRTSSFYEKDVAASTTATGRMMITYAKKMIEDVYGNRMYDTEKHGVVLSRAEYVYGDTDSVFFTFNLEDPTTGEPIRGEKALEITIEMAQDAAKLCSQWLTAPMELSYEKTLMPFILLSKKRYVGMLYETDPTKGKLKYMGLALKRRDACDYLKDVYGGILTILMGSSNDTIQRAVEFLDHSLEQLIQGKVGMDKLMITKALSSGYKNPERIGHQVLANRMGQRDPGNKPKPGDRIKYIFIHQTDKKALVGNKIETPEFIIENKLKIDYTYYITNQLMKPILQLFGLAIREIMELRKCRGKYTQYKLQIEKLQKEYPNLEDYNKKKEKLCSNYVEELVFKRILDKIHNDRNRINTMDGWLVLK